MTKHLLFFLLILCGGLFGVNALAGAFVGQAALPVRAGESDRQGCLSHERFTFSEPHMGTTVRIVLYAPDEGTARRAAKAAFARISELNKIMSDYDADSELMRLCKKAGGPPVPVSADLFQVLQAAEKYARLSDGAFDVSIGPVVRLWRKARKTGELPSAAAIKNALQRVDYRKIQLNPIGRTVRLLLVGMLLDLGGIAKGYAADAALAVLRQHSITRALVGLGGDIAVGDAPPGAVGWRVGVAPLKNIEAPASHFLLLKNAGVSTAGDLHQAVEIGGKRYSHIIDSRTGMALIGRRSATVIAPNATMSDGLDTGMCVLGAERGMPMIEKLDGVAALYVFETDKGEREIASRRFSTFVEKK